MHPDQRNPQQQSNYSQWKPILLVVLLSIWVLASDMSLSHQMDKSEEFTKRELVALRSQTVILQKGIEKIGEDFDRLKPPVDLVRQRVVPVGLQWVEDGGKVKFEWIGTAFPVGSSGLFATAGHVVEEVNDQLKSLASQELAGRAVVRLSTSEILPLKRIKIHPKYIESHKDQNTPCVDLAIFEVESEDDINGFTLSTNDAPQIGDTVIIAGFPTEVDQISYEEFLAEGFIPTVRIGFVERLVGLDNFSSTSESHLIQHSIPMAGGFSGSPVVNVAGEVVGIASFASHLLIPNRANDGSQRILNPSQVGFAVSKNLLEDLLPSAPEKKSGDASDDRIR